MENQTNQPPQPADSGSGNIPSSPESPSAPHAFKKTMPGRFASDGRPHRRAMPVQPQHDTGTSAASSPEISAVEAPKVPVAGSPKVSTASSPKVSAAGSPEMSASSAANRFEIRGTGKPAPPPKQPQQPVKRSVSVKPERTPMDVPFERTRLFLLAVIMVPLCIWGSWDSWGAMVYEWYHTDDYSHGFIVIPATLLFLYLRMETYPGTRYKLDWVGLFPIFLYGILRYFAAEQYIATLDAVAIWFWILGVVWFFYGWRVFLWALPSLCFLVFMFQLPYSVDMRMRNELQLFAAQSAAALLQTIGVAAIPITNTIRLSTMELGVEAACSGLRFLMSVFAIAFATVLLMRRPWWQNILILAVAAPLALFVNAVRIAITGVLLEYNHDMMAAWAPEGQSVGVFADGFAGKIGIALALGLFALFVWYLGKVFRRVEI